MTPTILRILLLEDDTDNLAMMKEVLEAEGWKVDAFSTYDDAFVCVEIKYDVVITDVILHRSTHDGYDLCKEFKRLHRSDVYTIAISGHDGADRYEGHEHADLYARKPISPDRLVEMVRNRPARVPHEVTDQINKIQENQDTLICEVAELSEWRQDMELKMYEKMDAKFERQGKSIQVWMGILIGWITLVGVVLGILS